MSTQLSDLFKPADTATRRLRNELEILKARYDHGGVSPAVFAAIRRVECEIAWLEHHAVPGGVR